MQQLSDIIRSIKPVDHSIEKAVQAHLDDLTKPQGSLGRLEEIAMRYCLITGSTTPSLGRKLIVAFAGDHGVTDEGVSAYPKAVTAQMVRNMLAGGAAINVLGRHAGAGVKVVDMGVDDPLEGAEGLCLKKIRRGTGNIARGPAMSVDEAIQAISAGYEIAEEAAKDGVTLLGTGEMGIANTTPSAALFSVLLPCSVTEITGRGTGIDNNTLDYKIKVIERAIEVNRARLTNPLETLAALGGFEIAGICGLILGGAALRIPVVVDGFISSAAALGACKMSEAVREPLFFSHCSEEKGHREFFRLYGEKPILDLGMRLGEGTGAALAMQIIEGAIKVYNEMATFSSAGVEEKQG
jgi:nicotinate-nucleotide--dimethylbenzimidazole phosphoribosyltransferase